MDFLEINKTLKKNLDYGKAINKGVKNDNDKWCFWFLGRVVNSDTKEPVAYCAYYEPTDKVVIQMAEGEDQNPVFLSANTGILMGTKLFSILLGGNNTLFEFENPTFMNA